MSGKKKNTGKDDSQRGLIKVNEVYGKDKFKELFAEFKLLFRKKSEKDKTEFQISNEDSAYRKKHGTVPALDAVNNADPLSLLPQIKRIPLSNYAKVTTKNIRHGADFKKILGGGFKLAWGAMSLGMGASGAYGLSKSAEGLGDLITTGANTKGSILGMSTSPIVKAERASYVQRQFLGEFKRADSRQGDLFLADGDGNDFHTGNGYYHFPNNDYFEGFWEDGQIRWGIYLYSSGERYLGGFMNGIKHGRGMTIYADGTCFYGLYNAGQRSFGTMWYNDGAYCGQFESDYHSGYGVAKYSDGMAFVGDWDDDSPVL